MDLNRLYVIFEDFIIKMTMPELMEDNKIYLDKEEVSPDSKSFYSVLEKFIIKMTMPQLMED